MSIIIPANSAVAGGFDVANSCNFEEGSLHKSVSSPSTTFTISIWVKLTNQYVGSSSIGQRYFWSGGDNSGASGAKWNDGNTGILDFYNEGTGHVNDGTGRNYRDPSAWYHWVWKNSGGTGTLYVNGVQQGSTFSMGPLIGSGGGNVINIGRYGAATTYAPMTMAEFVYLDGTGATPSSFGETDEDTGIWKPKSVSGLTFGTNGFYLDFQDSSNLGNDANGGTDLTKTGTLVQQTDTCTNNFCTMNPLENYYQAATLTEGNLKLLTATSSNTAPSLATFALTKGKWYYEAKYVSDSLAASSGAVGIVGTQILGATNSAMLETAQKYGLYLNDGNIWHNNSKVQDLGSHIDHTATIGISLDFDNNRITFSKDGGWGDGSGNWDEAAPNTFYTVAAPSTVDFGAYFPAFGDWSSGSIGYEINFGCPMYAISSSNSDADGFGNFEYAVPSGHFAICTKNLAEYG